MAGALVTMSCRAWEKGAVFSPMPKRLRPRGVRGVSGPRAAMIIAVTSSGSVIPWPSSATVTHESRQAHVKITSTCPASAAMLLSTRSATAASVL